MVTNERRSKEDPQRLLECLRDFVTSGGPQAHADVRYYLRMCLKAEELREQGWEATVRGRRSRWFVVVKGKRSLKKPLHFVPRAQLCDLNTQRKACIIIAAASNRNASRVRMTVVSIGYRCQIPSTPSPAPSAPHRQRLRPMLRQIVFEKSHQPSDSNRDV
jgi:hypothetical protein